MKAELDDLLCKKYPKLFAQRKLSPQETCMCWGFDCGDGWFALIDNLCSGIQFYVDHNDNVEQVEVLQVKEKFGTLRFYISGGNDFIEGMVEMAEAISGSMCELCGSPDNITRTEGYIRTLCGKCMKENNESNNRV